MTDQQSCLDRALSFRDALVELSGDFGPPYEPGTQAHADIQVPGLSRFASGLYASAFYTWQAAEDHTIQLGRLVDAKSSIATVPVVARAGLEALARAHWLLAPTERAHARVGRSVALTFASLCQRRKLFRDLDARDLLHDINDVIEQFASRVESAGFEISRDKNGKIQRLGQKLRSMTEMVKDLTGSSADYRYLSSLAHSEPMTLLAHLSINDPTKGTSKLASKPQEEQQSFKVVFCHYVALSREIHVATKGLSKSVDHLADHALAELGARRIAQ